MVYQSMVSMSDILVLVVVTIGEVPDNEFTMPAMNKMIEKLLPNIRVANVARDLVVNSYRVPSPHVQRE